MSLLPAGFVLTRIDDLPEGGVRSFTIGADTTGASPWPVTGFVLREAGQLHAYLNRCPHALRPLNMLPHRFLTPDGGLILCSAHGALFEKPTGQCVFGPCVGEQLTRLPVCEMAGELQLSAALDIDLLMRSPWAMPSNTEA